MYESCEIADLSHKYYVHISDRHSIEKGMTHFKRSIPHIAKIPSLTKKKENVIERYFAKSIAL